ncbi:MULTISPECIES: hypothetical protein [unclassified Streptomyces]|uniref:hypothetical protein n=1 Tax=unclassified Streptomyces TaxID=2593676 RepID=UPI0022545005|nr:hypothetical protein [Streptomyces sp. NBC_00063]MCX5442854.1 hypothetical protein [Streptomyces sp. NBC_00063]
MEGGTFEGSAPRASDDHNPSVMMNVSHGGGNMRQVRLLSASDDAGGTSSARSTPAGDEQRAQLLILGGGRDAGRDVGEPEPLQRLSPRARLVRPPLDPCGFAYVPRTWAPRAS